LLVSYLVVLVVNGPRSSIEAFPVSRWELFSMVPPRENTSYGVRLVEVDGVVLDPPRYFEESRDLFRSARSPDVPVLVARWGRHAEAGRESDAEAARRLFESRFLADAGTVRYELVLRRYDIVERVECGCYVSEEVLDAHRFG
jgi:hypothetical protein